MLVVDCCLEQHSQAMGMGQMATLKGRAIHAFPNAMRGEKEGKWPKYNC